MFKSKRKYLNHENISLIVSSSIILFSELKLSQPLSIHIKVDTGLHRQGFLLEEKDEVIKFLKSNPKIIRD